MPSPTATSGAGTRGAARLSTRISAKMPRPMASVSPWVCSSFEKKSAITRKKPPDSSGKPNRRPSCPTMMLMAMPFRYRSGSAAPGNW